MEILIRCIIGILALTGLVIWVIVIYYMLVSKPFIPKMDNPPPPPRKSFKERLEEKQNEHEIQNS